MKANLSLIMITRNSDELLEKSLNSVRNLVDEIVIADSFSTDKTVEIAKKFKAKIYNLKENDLGKKRLFALSKAKGEWILSLDADEIVSLELQKEIKTVITNSSRLRQVQSCTCLRSNNNASYPSSDPELGEESLANVSPDIHQRSFASVQDDTTGFLIPFQNHFLGRTINYGGENYKMLRLFKKSFAQISPNLVHERFEIKKGKVGLLKNKIYHYSYRSIPQVFNKFTDYAIREAKRKYQKKEKVSLKKIFLYPPHMFWARYIKDKGYRDGIWRMVLDVGFAYMEGLTYVVLFFYHWMPKSSSRMRAIVPSRGKSLS